MTATLKDRDISYLKALQLVDDELKLVFKEKKQTTKPDDRVAVYYFDMIHAETGAKMGFINVKAGYTDNIVHYRGNIGYAVLEQYQGKRYAARSCQLLKGVIKYLGLSAVYITCNADNDASRKAIESIGATYLETVTIGRHSPYYLYYTGQDRVKLRYIWEIE